MANALVDVGAALAQTQPMGGHYLINIMGRDSSRSFDSVHPEVEIAYLKEGRSQTLTTATANVGGTSGRSKWLEIEDMICTARRVQFYGLGVIVAYALSFAWRTLQHQWFVLPDGNMRCIDFGWMWLSGKLAASGEATRIFDYIAFSTIQLAFYGQESCPHFNRFYYPPTFLFLTWPLGWLPYLVAGAAWIAVGLALYETAVYAIVSRRAALIAAATPFFVAVNIDMPHTGLLTAAIIGLSLVFLERRPWVAGIFLGLLTYKPHFGLLFPLALFASRNWRALGSAAALTLILGVGAAVAFGYEGWASFIDALTDRSSSLAPGAEVELRLHSIFGLLHWVGASPGVAWCAQLAISAAMAVVICVLWARPIPFNLRAASLCVGSVIVSPYVLYYDLCILSLAVAFLVKEGLSRGFLPGERTAILLCWPALFLVKAPIGVVVSLVLAFLCSRRVIDEPAVMVFGRYRANSENASLVVGEQALQSQIGHTEQPPSAR